jgi:hypothetical protein
MKKSEKIIQSGPFKGKRIEFASTIEIERFRDVAEDFMKQVFEFDPGDYLITDESRLRDFTGREEDALRDIHQKIRAIYDVDVSDLASGNLLEIFARLRHQRDS